MIHLDTYHNITEEVLNEADRKQLLKGLIFIPVFAIICGGVFWIMLSVKDTFFFYVVIGMASIFAVVIFFISRALILDLIEGVKNVLKGIITRKETYDRNAGGRSGAPDWHYFLYFGSFKLEVNKKQYDDFKENDLVEIKMTKRGKNFMDHRVIKHDAIQGELLYEGKELSKKVAPTPKWVIVVIVIVFIAFVAGIITMFYFE